MYHNRTLVITVYGNSEVFEVEAGIHQGSEPSPLLFTIVTKAILGEFRVGIPWKF